jgi:hypothetical protein
MSAVEFRRWVRLANIRVSRALGSFSQMDDRRLRRWLRLAKISAMRLPSRRVEVANGEFAP